MKHAEATDVLTGGDTRAKSVTVDKGWPLCLALGAAQGSRLVVIVFSMRRGQSIMGDRYENLLTQGATILHSLNPSLGNSLVNNCPATADAVDNYLTNGVVAAADASHSRYILAGGGHFQHRSLVWIRQRLIQLGHGAHVTVRGNRASGSTLGPTHFFNMVNIRSVVYVVDGFTNDITSLLVRPAGPGPVPPPAEDPYYFRRQDIPITTLEVSTHFDVRPDPGAVVTLP